MAILRLQQSIQRAPDFRGYICHFFIKALVTPQSMIEEISLQAMFAIRVVIRLNRGSDLKVAHSRDTNQHVQVIGHQQK